MKKYLTFILFLLPIIASAETNPPDLIKVDANNKSTCVEYYSYKGGLYCSSKALQSNSIDPAILSAEKQNIVFDDRPWALAWGKQTDTITTIEYVPKGDNINSWNELVTSQFIPVPESKSSLKEYADKVKQDLAATGFKTNFNILKEDTNQIIFEFQVSEPKNQQQDELQKVTRTPKGFYLLHYVIKKPDMGTADRQKWLANLEKSTIKE